MTYRVGDPDPTPDFNGDCEAVATQSPDGTQFFCTWPTGHTGSHVAGTGEAIAAVWNDAPLTFTLTIELGNEGMQSPDDVAHALSDIAQPLWNHFQPFDPRDDTNTVPQVIRDVNGNRVGNWAVK